jgi:chromate transporter
MSAADAVSAGSAASRGSAPPAIPFRTAVRVWARIGLLSFGGPAGQIALMHRVLVQELGWIGERRFLHALNYCMLLPGPEAQQLATYVGWLLHGVKGGLVAGTLFVLPGFLAIMAFSVAYVFWSGHPVLDGVLLGLKAAVLALVAEAVFRIGRRALRSWSMRIVATLAFVAIFVVHVPFPFIVITAALFGYCWTHSQRRASVPAESPATDSGGGGAADQTSVSVPRPSGRRALAVVALCLPLWFLPIALIATWGGGQHVLTQLGIFFSKMAVVIFGGAYAVLAYVAQEAAGHFQWVTPTQMLDGLGLAETTPGPLILVVQFVGFLAAYQAPGGLPPLIAGIAGACLTVWVTFVPCFLWIFLGAPYVESLRRHSALSGALEAITAAVVGVIANVALWFGLHALFRELRPLNAGVVTLDMPVLSSIQWLPALLTALALILVFPLRWGTARTLAVCTALGIVCSVFRVA